jgi:uncharacterized phage protein (predicted DNA packaging)
MELSEVKKYLRIDDDLADDDATLTSLISAGRIYLESATGKKYDDANTLMNTFIKLFVKDVFEGEKNAALAKAKDSILSQIKISQDFAGVDAS